MALAVNKLTLSTFVPSTCLNLCAVNSAQKSIDKLMQLKAIAKNKSNDSVKKKEVAIPSIITLKIKPIHFALQLPESAFRGSDGGVGTASPQVGNEFTILFETFPISKFGLPFVPDPLCWDFMVNFVDLYAYCITNGLPSFSIYRIRLHAARQQCNRTKIGRRRHRRRLRPTLPFSFQFSEFDVYKIQNARSHTHTPTNWHRHSNRQ